MAVTGKVGDGVIQIAVAGLEKAKAQLNSLKKLVDGATAAKSGKGGAGKAADAAKSGKGGAAEEALPLLARFAPLLASVGTAATVLGTALTVVAAAVAAATAGVAAFAAVAGVLVRIADPVRFTAFATKLEVAAIIIGRQFIPVLQTLLILADKVNAALRKAFDGGAVAAFSKAFSGNFERFVNSLMPLLNRGLAVVTDLFTRLIPIVDQFGDTFDDIANTLVDAGLIEDLVQPLADLFVELGQLGANLSTVFGAALQGFLIGAIKVVGLLVSALAGLLSILNQFGTEVGEAFKTAVDILIDGMNAVIGVMNTIFDKLNDLIGKLEKLTGIDLGGFEFGQIDEIEKPDYNRRRNRPQRPELTTTPQQYIQPQFVGLEEMFRKANTAATNDPRREAELERKRQLDRQIQLQEEIAGNTRRRGMASGVGGDFSGAEGAGASMPDF